MKVEIKADDSGYPKLMQSKINEGRVVLFTSERAGVIVASTLTDDYVGYYTDMWCINNFTPYNDTIRLTNYTPKPYEIIPDGWRLVTDDERKQYELPPVWKSCSKAQNDVKFGSKYQHTWGYSDCLSHEVDYVAFIVPIDYSWTTSMVTVTMDHIAELIGCDVKQLNIEK